METRCPVCHRTVRVCSDTERVWQACTVCAWTGPLTGLRVDSIWAYLAVDKDGNEGVIGINTPYGMMPAVGADEERVMALRAHIVIDAKRLGLKVKLVKFGKREDVEEIT